MGLLELACRNRWWSAGASIDIDLDKIKNVDLGDVVVTTAGNLPQRYVFHCIADKRRSSRDLEIIPVIINRSVTRCLQILPSLGVISIAFPAIGTGAVGLSNAHVAKSMLKSITEHLCKTSQNLYIEIFAYGLSAFIEWIEEAKAFSQTLIDISDIQETHVSPVENSYDIFISYSWVDEKVALDLEEWLKELGIHYFLDRRILVGGQDHKDKIISVLRNSKLVLFLSSKDSNQSEYVKGEIHNSTELHIPIIPLRIDMSPYRNSFQFDLVNVIWIDFIKGLETKKMNF